MNTTKVKTVSTTRIKGGLWIFCRLVATSHIFLTYLYHCHILGLCNAEGSLCLFSRTTIHITGQLCMSFSFSPYSFSSSSIINFAGLLYLPEGRFTYRSSVQKNANMVQTTTKVPSSSNIFGRNSRINSQIARTPLLHTLQSITSHVTSTGCLKMTSHP